MTSSQYSELDLPFRRSDGKRSVEKVMVEKLGPNRFKLVYSPGMVEGLAAGDEFEIGPDNPAGYKVVRRSGNLCVWFFFEQAGQNRGPEAEHLRKAVEDIGGRLDGGGHYSLVFTIPVSLGFQMVERLFDEATIENPGSTWMFGNVYDPVDGKTPLNWWSNSERN